MKEDFLKGKDFRTSAYGGPYFSIRDFTENAEYMKDFAGVLLVQVSPNPYFQGLLSREEMCQHSTQHTSST
jgi:hypothetical protein